MPDTLLLSLPSLYHHFLTRWHTFKCLWAGILSRGTENASQWQVSQIRGIFQEARSHASFYTVGLWADDEPFNRKGGNCGSQSGLSTFINKVTSLVILLRASML